MKLINVILENSPTVKEAKLYGPAQTASKVPETGIKIVNKAAYHVIKDCATFTVKYLPLYIFGMYAGNNITTFFKGKLEAKDIEEFLKAAKEDIVYNQLLVLIKHKISLLDHVPQSSEVHDPYSAYSAYELSEFELLCQYLL